MFSVASARKFEIIVFPAWLGPTTATFTLYIFKMSFSLVGGITGFQDFRVSEFQVGNHMVEDGISGGKEVVQRQGR